PDAGCRRPRRSVCRPAASYAPDSVARAARGDGRSMSPIRGDVAREVPGNPWFSWRYVEANADEILSRLLEHVTLTGQAVLIAAAVGVPLAVLAYWVRPATGPILAGAGVLYTIPSLAVFE